ncbi:hypothetical protein Q5P01_004319 [Channa striata]|uniref:Uncharacterized protein n=1 Tax=Channa striata TaxID=64152 RepID=A0AA88NHG5_CHASR|nr:hypothetical protein Q5P01_004319 [Channa striata]
MLRTVTLLTPGRRVVERPGISGAETEVTAPLDSSGSPVDSAAPAGLRQPRAEGRSEESPEEGTVPPDKVRLLRCGVFTSMGPSR